MQHEKQATARGVEWSAVVPRASDQPRERTARQTQNPYFEKSLECVGKQEAGPSSTSRQTGRAGVSFEQGFGQWRARSKRHKETLGISNNDPADRQVSPRECNRK